MNKKIKWGLIAISACALCGIGIYSQLPKPNKELMAVDKMSRGKKNEILNINALVINRQKLVDEIRVTGITLPNEEVDLSFETSGKVIGIYFKEGTHVHKGQLLAKVNDEQLKAQLKRLTSQLKLAEDRVFRQSALLKKDAVSKEAYELVRTELATLQAEIDMVKAQINLTELRAPFAGIIGLRQVSIGAYASPTTQVSKLTCITPLKVEFSVPERYSSQMKDGLPLEFTIDGSLEAYKAKVYASESSININTHTLTARALYPNSNGKLMAGRYASIKLIKDEIDNAIAIPSEAIVPEMGKDKVFLYKSGKATPVEITTGIRTESQVEVLKGLNVGDTLITSGTLQLRTDLPVTIDQLLKK
jgi:membrane fusion protein, multidrug efflux system